MAGGGAMLAAIPDHKLTQFVHHVIDHMCGGEPVTYDLYKDGCSLDKFWLAIQETKTVAKITTQKKLPRNEVVNTLHELGKMKAGNVCDAFSARRTELEDYLVREALHHTHLLKNFDWSVRLAVSSDKVMDLNEPLLTLHLHTSPQERDVCVEMTAPQVDNLLHKLKEAQCTLAQLSSQGPS
ncbi:hypothetical protein Pcinc_034320 [Petrolisthes cinctipes]|uniref:COMM domain-containing protein n=1 Tax=Petrolisthes cinctipes TaxID=88211 RepID=A0AAE1JXK5_PETCI|nr:hypothetical protein Pcinc_034320 [Petrolisthes cinctipes]